MKTVFLAVLFMSSIFITDCVSSYDTTSNVAKADADASPSQTPKKLSRDDIARRDEVEARMMRGEYLHDGPSELIEIGDIDSVPAILVVLKENPLSPKGTMICTRAHALSALRQITGASLGATDEAWFGWWAEYKKNNPGPRRLEK